MTDHGPRAVLLQPDPGPGLSGGYLYNTHMAEEGAFALVNVAPGGLEPALREASKASVIIVLDSLWLRAPELPTLLQDLAAGCRIHLLLHAFPSAIDAASEGRPAEGSPTAEELRLLRQCAGVLLPGPHHAETLRAAGLPVHVAEPGLDDRWRCPPRARTGPLEVISVGAVTRIKGFVDVARALRALEDVDWRWTVVGSLDTDRTYADELRSVIDGDPRIELEGGLPPEGARRLLHRAHVLAFASRTENHPLVVMEAVASSVPVVGYAVGGVGHLVTHGEHGFLGPVGDVDTLAAHLQHVADDEDLRWGLAERCALHQRTWPSWAEAAARLRRSLVP